jgi:4-pyridoxate dehydrogenase
MRRDFDYVIVGAGSAGCVLAHRLGEDRAVRVLVLEAGGADRSPLIKIPLTWGLILKDRLFDWGYFTEPEVELDGRRIECARGKVVGGCTSINGMALARGAPQDFDHWASDLGLPDWSYAHVLPHFRKCEAWERGASNTRGADGPLTVETSRFADPLVDAFLEATAMAGYPRNPDYNADSIDGFGEMQTTIRRGLRCSASVAYLRPALARGNVELRVNALATRVLFEGTKAIGIEYVARGVRHEVRASREVLLCGGVINSPQLLMLSGIGDPAQLARHGITVRSPVAGVGGNLQDHVVADVRYRRNGTGPLHRVLRADRIAVDVTRAFLTGKGIAGSLPAAVTGFIRSEAGTALPDAQVILAGGPMTAAPWLRPFRKPYVDAFGFKGLMLQPESRGTVTLAANDPTRAPVIRQNFLSTERDRRTMRETMRRMRDIGRQPPLRAFIAEELAPGASETSDAQIDAFVRRTAITLHHPVGTCKMGATSDAMAVLDGAFRVRGIDNLRVIDGSAMPRIIRGNTNAPILMMAEKAADLLRARVPPPPVSSRSHESQTP